MEGFTGITTTGDIEAGDLVAFELEGATIAIANVDDEFFAFADTCTHAGCSLAEGELEGTTLTCPCHGGQFDVKSGKVLSGPPTESVRTYAIRLEGDEIQVGVLEPLGTP